MHLVWAPSGADYLRTFLNAYSDNDPGADHELILLYNGFESQEQHDEFDRVAATVPHTKFVNERTTLDLDAYHEVVRRHPSDHYLFANTYARPQVDGWLELLLKHQRRPDVGMVAPSGSWESMGSLSPIVTRPYRLAQFKAFPNPHLRTGVFMTGSDVIDRLNWFPVKKKIDAWKLENGRHGFSQQVLRLGLKLIVGGADGVGYEWEDWPASRTFRSGEQENLVIADNRTDIWRDASAAERSELARLAWGGAAE